MKNTNAKHLIEHDESFRMNPDVAAILKDLEMSVEDISLKNKSLGEQITVEKNVEKVISIMLEKGYRPVMRINEELQDFITDPANTSQIVDLSEPTLKEREITIDKGNPWINGRKKFSIRPNELVIELKKPSANTKNTNEYVIDLPIDQFRPYYIGQRFNGRVDFKDAPVFNINSLIAAQEYAKNLESESNKARASTREKALRLVK